MPYFEYMPRAAVVWLKGANGQKWMEATGLSIDQMAELWRSAVRQRFPFFAASDALASLGTERQMERGLTESEATYRNRIHLAWDLWLTAGSHGSMLRVLRDMGYPNAAIVQQNGMGSTLLGDVAQMVNLGTNPLLGGIPWWTFDTNDLMWSRFAVLFFPPFPAGWTNIQTPPSPSSLPSDSEVDIIRRTIQKWKPAKATLVGISVMLDGRCIGWPVRIIGNGTTIVPFGATNGGAVVAWTP
jgi:hypothetical protein